MNREFIIDCDRCYWRAERRASHYFKLLSKQVKEKTYIGTLKHDLASSFKLQTKPLSFLTFMEKKKTSRNFRRQIKWLEYTGKLDVFLERSISYIFLRDLGKTLDSSDIQERIQTVVNDLKSNLTTTSKMKSEVLSGTFSFLGMYRWGQREGIEETIIWLFQKLTSVSKQIPKEIDSPHAQRKLIKIIMGVLMHQMEEMTDQTLPEIRVKKLDEAIRLGYSYGLTYPFIDDLLDSNIFTSDEKKQYAELIRTSITTSIVAPLGQWPEEKMKMMSYIHRELKEAFEYIHSHQTSEKRKIFTEQSYVFFQSQELDRLKDLSNPQYTNEELYIPIILKSSSSRLMARSVLNTHDDDGFNTRTFLYGIYNQLADDFADLFDDLEADAVTPYTYYFKYHQERPDLINPFELYWTVITNLIHNVYHSDVTTKKVILARAINGLRRYKEKHGVQKYKEVMQLFAFDPPESFSYIQTIVEKAEDVDFLDKLIRDELITELKKENEEQEEFFQTIKAVRNEINQALMITKSKKELLVEDPITEAANYSLEGNGKRLRPIIAWFMGVRVYGLNEVAFLPVLKSIEYLHTASLIFDDLPAQDDAHFRRGRRTVHELYNVAVAELTGVFLTMKAMEEQSSLEQFDAGQVLKMIQYSAHVTAELCKGQAMDLASKGQQMTIEQLNMLCFYKTGLSFEASLVIPAILAYAEDKEIEELKKFAYHAGIAFQIKDDILDVEGDADLLGKPTHKDTENMVSNFVSLLGVNSAKKQMWDHYCLAIESLQSLPNNNSFLKHLLNYFVTRER